MTVVGQSRPARSVLSPIDIRFAPKAKIAWRGPEPDSMQRKIAATRVSSRLPQKDRYDHQQPRDQRTGSIKCSYCVPGHIT